MKIAANIKINLFLPNCFWYKQFIKCLPKFLRMGLKQNKDLFIVYYSMCLVLTKYWLTGDSHHSLVFLPQAAQA